MESKYIGTDGICGFKKNHKYEIEINKPKGYCCYNITAFKDITENLIMEKVINYASRNSIERNWEIKVPY